MRMHEENSIQLYQDSWIKNWRIVGLKVSSRRKERWKESGRIE